MRILNADDVAENRYLLEFMLRSAGHEVVSVQDGQEALAVLGQGRYDMVVSDVLMPRMDGFQLCRELKKQPGLRDVPFVFYTATYTDEKDAALGLSLGAARFVIKPQEPAAFLRIIQEVVSEAARGKATAPPQPEPEGAFLAAYTQRLVRKLDAKVSELRQLSGRLQEELRAREREVAERRVAEEALRAREADLEAAQRVARVGSFEARVAAVEGLREGTLRCSRELLRLAGREGQASGELRGRELLEAVEAGERPRLVEALRAAFAGRSPGPLALWLGPVDGVRRAVEVRMEAGAPGPGGERELTGTVQDVTERRRLEGIARQAQKMENLGLLAAGVAHDFKNVLTSILMNAEALVTGGTLAARDHEAAREIVEAAERADTLTGQLLSFAQRRELSLRQVDLREVVERLAGMLRRVLGKGVRLECLTAAEPLEVRADVNLLEQVIVNLVVNARDATPAGGLVSLEAGRAEVDADHVSRVPEARAGTAMRIAVADTGAGIAPEHLPRLFEPFFTTKPEGKGTGLGLATVYGIVRQHRGWVEVESAPGEGSRFEVYLPLAEDVRG